MGTGLNINYEILFRILLAVAAGGAIGLQREYSRNAAGFRTHMLVCLGACIAMVTNEFLYLEFPGSGVDVSRMGSYVISGIGFLGAGAIIKDGVSVRGLTTAAGLWVVACLGIAIGAGYYTIAVFAVITIVIILTIFKTLEKKFHSKRDRTIISMQIKNSPGQLASILSAIAHTGVLIKSVDIDDSDDKWVNLELMTTLPNTVGISGLHEMLEDIHGVRVVSIEFT